MSACEYSPLRLGNELESAMSESQRKMERETTIWEKMDIRRREEGISIEWF